MAAAAPEGDTWVELEREESPQCVYITYRCRVCRKRAIGIGARKPTPCCCEAKP